MRVDATQPTQAVMPSSSAVSPPRSGAAAAAAAPKKDTLVLSEQAKDLAALKAGKAAQEEMSESISAKMKEGDAD